MRCWPVFKNANKPATVHHVRHVHRIGRAIKRAGGIAVSKPAIISWACLSLWWPAPLGQSAIASVPSAAPFITAGISPWYVLPCCAVELPGRPPTEWPFAGPPVLLPDVPLVPDVPTSPEQPVPEPSSLALLVAALAGMGASYRVIKIRADGVKLPYGRLVRSQFSARRTARLLAVTNADPAVDHFAVSDGAEIVFRAPSNGRVEHG